MRAGGLPRSAAEERRPAGVEDVTARVVAAVVDSRDRGIPRTSRRWHGALASIYGLSPPGNRGSSRGLRTRIAGWLVEEAQRASIVALSVAAVLAVFLLYTSIAAAARRSFRPSQLAGHHGRVSLMGQVVGTPSR